MRLTLLGTGNAAQVPVYNCSCPACSRARVRPEFRRGPCCALVECGASRWLIDAGLPDLTRRFAPASLDGILLTHYHADHAQGLLHLRWGTGLRIPVLAPPDPEGLSDLHKHPGILDFSTVMQPLQPVQLGPLRVTPIPLTHSRPTFGYLLEHEGQRAAYLTDTSGLPDDSLSALRTAALDMLVLDCTYPPADRPPRNHNDLNLALETVQALRPRTAILTHIGHKLDAWLMREQGAGRKSSILPIDVTVGRDGSVLECGSAYRPDSEKPILR